jgi:hypothetical protein
MAWWRHRCAPLEDPVDKDSQKESREALERARAAKVRARGHLATVREFTGEIERERIVNHLAQDVYEAMRRKR